jgi:CHAT domain-containing protein
MTQFYTSLWLGKVPKSRALWQAKKQLRSRGAPARDWAGWVLSGDPN